MVTCQKHSCGCGAHNYITFDPPIDINTGISGHISSTAQRNVINYTSLPPTFQLHKIHIKITLTGGTSYVIEPEVAKK